MSMEAFNAEIKDHNMARFKNLLMWDEQKLNKFVSSMAHCVQTTPKLLECSKESVLNSFIKCAELDLYPSSVGWEAFILPYAKNKKLPNGTWDTSFEAQFQLWYQGIVTLLYRAWIQFIESNIVYANDVFEIEQWAMPKLIHKPDPFKSIKDRGEAMGCYVVVTVNNHTAHKFMNKEDILKFKEFSQSKNSDYSPWVPKNDPELWMWRKTVLKQFAKTLPKNRQLKVAIEYDNADGNIKLPKEEREQKVPDLTLLDKAK